MKKLVSALSVILLTFGLNGVIQASDAEKAADKTKESSTAATPSTPVESGGTATQEKEKDKTSAKEEGGATAGQDKDKAPAKEESSSKDKDEDNSGYSQEGEEEENSD